MIEKMKKCKILNNSGYSLFELVVVMVILSILVTASMRSMQNSVDIAKTEETKEELQELASAIVGDPELISGGKRINYGYVGDIGALPSSLNDLVTDPGYATWDGPYIKDDFYASSGSSESEFLIDGWGQTYSYTGIAISSTGGSTTITRELANNTNEILYNSASFNIVDLDFCPPGLIDKDSVQFNLIYPNGLGSYQTDSKFPSAGGFVKFDSIPIGQQTLSVIELKNNDTLTQNIHINPNSSIHTNIQVPTSLWCDTSSSGGGSGVETLRPNGAGSLAELTTNCSNNWQCVDEVTSDDDGTYNRGSGNSWLYDLYAVTNSTVGTGTVDSVIVYTNVQGNGGNRKTKTYIQTNSSTYLGSQITPSSSYAIYSTTYITNPQSSSAWTWTEIDAIEIGAGIRREARITQVWIEVYYTN